MRPLKEVRPIEKLLHTPPPDTVSEIRYHKHQPNPFVTYHDAYIRLQLPEADYQTWMQQMEMQPMETTPYALLEPGIWKLKTGIHLEWWSEAEGISGQVFARPAGKGWMVAKYESGFAYLHVFVPE